MVFEVKQEVFAGPFHLLLELLDKKELEITQISLAAIADEFLKRFEAAEVTTEELADFLLVATRLIYLKTKELLPYLNPEEEAAAESLVDRLRLYQYFVEHAQFIRGLVEGDHRSFTRPPTKQKVTELPLPKLQIEDLRLAFLKLLKRNEPFFLLKEKSLERVASVQERMAHLREALLSRARFTFKEVIGAGSRAEAVVSFLALLELLKQRVIRAKQGDNHNIMIERI